MSRQTELALAVLVGGLAGSLLTLAWVARPARRAPPPNAPSAEAPPEGGDAWARVRAHPREPEAWGALGDAEAALDDVVAAEHAYTVALSLGTRDAKLLGRLGFLLYQRGEERRAETLLREAKQRGAELPMLDFTLEQLARRRASAPVADAGLTRELTREPTLHDAGVFDGQVPSPTCSIPLETHSSGTRRVTVLTPGANLTLVFDTGASITSLTPDALTRLGIAPDLTRTIRAHTAGGVVRMPTATLPGVTLGGRTMGPLTVAVCEGCASLGTDGLLGLDAQAGLGLELDLKRGVLRLADCP